MPEMYLRHPGFTYSACGLFTKNKERIKKFKETRDSRYIYQNELKLVFNMIWSSIKVTIPAHFKLVPRWKYTFIPIYPFWVHFIAADRHYRLLLN